MTDTKKVSKEMIRHMAEAVGLETDEVHIEELYGYVKRHLPNAEAFRQLDLAGVEPAPTYVPSKES